MSSIGHWRGYMFFLTKNAVIVMKFTLRQLITWNWKLELHTNQANVMHDLELQPCKALRAFWVENDMPLKKTCSFRHKNRWTLRACVLSEIGLSQENVRFAIQEQNANSSPILFCISWFSHRISTTTFSYRSSIPQPPVSIPSSIFLAVGKPIVGPNSAPILIFPSFDAAHSLTLSSGVWRE